MLLCWSREINNPSKESTVSITLTYVHMSALRLLLYQGATGNLLYTKVKLYQSRPTIGLQKKQKKEPLIVS